MIQTDDLSELVTMTMADFQRLVLPMAIYTSWEDAIHQMSSDRVNRQVISDLISQHHRDGGFNKPLIVDDGVLANGYHRFCALVAAGAMVTFRYGYPEVEDATSSFDLIFDVGPSEKYVPAPNEGPEDWIYEAMFVSRSMPCGSGWLEFDGLSARESKIWMSLFDEPEDLDVVVDAVLNRLRDFGFDASFVGTEVDLLD